MAYEFSRVRRELTDQFGGVTAYSRAPAKEIPERAKSGMISSLSKLSWSASTPSGGKHIAHSSRHDFNEDRILNARAQLPNTLGGRPVGLYYRPQ